MENNSTIQPVQKSEPAPGIIIQFDQYLAQQPPSKQRFHKWMVRLQAASLGFVVAIFVWALLVSVRWTQVNPLEIPLWWMVFAASILPFALFLGLHAIVLRALLPLPLKLHQGGRRSDKAGNRELVTGVRALLLGIFIVLVGVVWAGINLTFAYSMLTLDMDVLDVALRLLGIVIGVVVAVQVLSDLFRRFSRA